MYATDTLNTTTPLVNQVLLTWLTVSYAYVRTTDEERAALGLQQPQGIGYGIGLAFAIFGMQRTSRLLKNILRSCRSNRYNIQRLLVS